jgi:hypothetical protein
MDVTENSWTSAGYTHVTNRVISRNIVIVLFTSKCTEVNAYATSQVGAEDGGSQVTSITNGPDNFLNAHAATFGTNSAPISWGEISDPTCDHIAMHCCGQFAGSSFQQVGLSGKKVGEAPTSTETHVAGDIVTMAGGRVSYVCMTWDLCHPVGFSSTATKKMSFASISPLGKASYLSNSSSSTSK